jgi:O-6-methylguanine DNA methyltransferase
MNTTISSQHITLAINTADGRFIASYSEVGLCRLEFPQSQSESPPTPAHVPKQVLVWHELTTEALGRALSGREPGKLPPLDLSGGTLFQRRVWEAMRRLSAGSTGTYGQLAAAIGNRRATRAVGSACGANPIPVLIPCHRVVAASGLGGFSADPKWKRLLLAREQTR